MESCKIRIATEADAEACCEIYAPYVENTAVTFEFRAPSPEEFRRRITETLKTYPWVIAEQNGEVMGYAYASVFRVRPAYRRSVETSIYVRAGKTKSGIGRALYEALEDILSRQGVLNLYADVAVTDEEDPHLTRNSQEFHTHMGYRTVGIFHACAYKFDKWYDLAALEKYLDKHPEHPCAFIPFSELRKTVKILPYA